MVIGDANVRQQLECGCALKCQQLIMRDYGFDIAEGELCELSKRNGWYHENGGVFMRDNGKLLGSFGIGYHHRQHCTLADVERELRQGHRVMASVNADKLHAAPEERFCHLEASHAVLISRVDRNEGLLYIADPMTGNVDEPCPIRWFLHAWRDSLFYMLATDSPACFCYDPDTHSMKELTISSNRENYVV